MSLSTGSFTQRNKVAHALGVDRDGRVRTMRPVKRMDSAFKQYYFKNEDMGLKTELRFLTEQQALDAVQEVIRNADSIVSGS
jgi:hypothetical protein